MHVCGRRVFVHVHRVGAAAAGSARPDGAAGCRSRQPGSSGRRQGGSFGCSPSAASPQSQAAEAAGTAAAAAASAHLHAEEHPRETHGAGVHEGPAQGGGMAGQQGCQTHVERVADQRQLSNQRAVRGAAQPRLQLAALKGREQEGGRRGSAGAARGCARAAGAAAAAACNAAPRAGRPAPATRSTQKQQRPAPSCWLAFHSSEVML